MEWCLLPFRRTKSKLPRRYILEWRSMLFSKLSIWKSFCCIHISNIYCIYNNWKHNNYLCFIHIFFIIFILFVILIWFNLFLIILIPSVQQWKLLATCLRYMCYRNSIFCWIMPNRLHLEWCWVFFKWRFNKLCCWKLLEWNFMQFISKL